MNDWLADVFRDRPWWMNAAMVFCAYMAFIYVPWDFFVKPVDEDAEVWFGILFTGVWAKILAIPHWFVYGAGYYGFRRRRPWMAVWAPIYLAQVAFSMAVWPIVHYGGWTGVVFALIAFVPFALITYLFWANRDHFAPAPRALRDRYGDWALVTGASAGIGEAFAKALAREGMNVIVTARRQDRLDALAASLRDEFGVEARGVSVDLASEGGPEELVRSVEDTEIGLLVNNAGFGYAGRFDKQETGRLREMVLLNCVAPTIVTHLLLPGMVRRRRGGVIFTGSVSGRQPLPLHATYSATKGFDALLAEGLFVEMRAEGVDMLVLEAGSTVTEFQSVAGQLPHEGQSVEEVVETGLDALGKQPAVVSGWWNWARATAVVRVLPRTLVAYVARQIMERQTPVEMR